MKWYIYILDLGNILNLLQVHHFDIATTGVLSSVPYLARFFFAFGFGFIGDFLFKKKKISSAAVRKWFTIFCTLLDIKPSLNNDFYYFNKSLAHFVPACLLIGLSFVGNKPYLSVALMSAALGSCGSMAITSLQNPHDLSPNFATTIFAFIHTVGSTPGCLSGLLL